MYIYTYIPGPRYAILFSPGRGGGKSSCGPDASEVLRRDSMTKEALCRTEDAEDAEGAIPD